MLESARARSLLEAAAILAAVAVAYIPLTWAGFIWDDDVLLYAAPLVHAPDGLYRFWFTTEAYEYYPVANSALWLEWCLFGPNPLWYHLVSGGLHAATSLLLWRVLRRLAIPGAWLIALVFAVHPVNAASVMWIAQRKNGLALLFAAFSALAFLRAEDESSQRWYALSLGGFVLALLSKTAVAALPVVLLGFVWWRRGRIRRPDLWRVLPWFAVSGVLSLATIYFQYTNGITPELHAVVRPEGFASRLASVGWAFWFYVSKALWPSNLVMIYPRWDVIATQPLHWAPLVLLLGVCALAWWRLEKGGRAVLFGLGCTIAMLLPVLGFFKIYHHRFSLVADQWQYPAIIATLALAIGGSVELWRWRDARGRLVGITIAALLVTTLTALTFRRALVFQSDLTLFSQNAIVHPDSHGALYHLGLSLARHERIDEAMVAYRKALDLDPLYAEAHYNLAELERVAGSPARALFHYEQATQRPSIAPMAYYGQGRVHEALGHWREARDRYAKALESDPGYEPAREALDRLLERSP